MAKQIFISILLCIYGLFLHAQENIIPIREYSTKRIIGASPSIDGIADDKAWEMVEWSGDFTQKDPYEYEPPSQQTAFKILYNDNNLYVLIRAFDTEPDKIEKRLSRRDSFEGDWVGIALDSYNDNLTGFSFNVTAAGVKGDVIMTSDNQMDDTWNPVWYVKVSTDELGWIAEMRIPLTQLRFSKVEDHVWGLEVMRSLFRKEEFSVWQMVPQEASGWVSLWGDLVGINNINPKKEIEIIPYLMGSLKKSEKDENDPFATGTSWNYNAGIDGKIAVTNDLTLNFTINPDFGQVEADPSEVNLSAFESYFEEKRPFFIEGSNIFNFPITGDNNRNNLFYSRRIGRQPHYYPEINDNEYIELSEVTRILGAFKLSGKTRNGWSIGVLESFTNKEMCTIDSAGIQRKEAIEPFTNFFNARVQKDINKGNTIVGGMFTATNRFINDSSLYYIPNSAYTGGIDFTNYWNNKNYYFKAKGVFSTVSGDSSSITYLQREPQRYYQRPDMEHRTVDSSLTTLSGYGGNIEAGKLGGGNWRYGMRAWWLSPGLEVNDMGFMQRVDAISQTAWINYIIWNPFSIFRNMNFSFSQWSWWDFSGRYLNLGARISTNAQFINYWSYNAGIMRNGLDVNRSELRGGPSVVNAGNWNTWLGIHSDSRKKLVFHIFGAIDIGDNNSKLHQDIELLVSYRPLNSLHISLSPEFTVDYDKAKYVETIENVNGDKYIVGALTRHITSMDIRIEFSITPDLSLQYWGQPFIYSANYSRFADVVDAGNKNTDDQYYVYSNEEISYDEKNDLYEVNEVGQTSFTFENPDFSIFEFRSNFVIRWEYIPGSTAYFVWSQAREGDVPDGNFAFNEHLSNIVDVAPGNIFLLKFSYRFSM